MLLIFYWVGGSGVGDFATHWVTTSGGATFQTNTNGSECVFFELILVHQAIPRCGCSKMSLLLVKCIFI
jgi:hypothetical protein